MLCGSVEGVLGWWRVVVEDGCLKQLVVRLYEVVFEAL
jgi:hypothetical protein